jgi:hypothetical protein
LSSNKTKKQLSQKILELQYSIWNFIFASLLNLKTRNASESLAVSNLSPNEAKKFLSQRISETARRNGVPFDDLEEKMLCWTSDHEDMDLVDKFAEKHNDKDYEKKIIGLLKSSYEHDRENDSIELQEYNDAYAALLHGDHYLTFLLDQSIGNKISPPGSHWLGKPSNSAQDYLNLILTGLALFVVFLVSVFVYICFFDSRYK